MSEPEISDPDWPLSKRARASVRRLLCDPDNLTLPNKASEPVTSLARSLLPPPFHLTQTINIASEYKALTTLLSDASECADDKQYCSSFSQENANVDMPHMPHPSGFVKARVCHEIIETTQSEDQTPLFQPNVTIPALNLLLPKTAALSPDKQPAAFSELLLPEICPLRSGAGPALDISYFFRAETEAESQDKVSYVFPNSPEPADPDCLSFPPTKPSAPTLAHPSEGASVSLPLFDGSPLTANDCVVAILTYAQANHLSGTSTCELIRLLEILLPQPNNLPKSTMLLKKYFKDDESQLQLYLFCSNCWSNRASFNDICTKCSAPNRKVSYYITCSLELQLQRLYARPGFCKLLEYKYNRKKENEANIEDIFDAKIYREAQKNILSNPNNISFTWYSDGVQIYEVSCYGLWISMFTITELPPEERHKSENVLIGGIWGGDCKPHPNIFLLPMYHDIVQVNNGVKVRPNGSQNDIIVCGFLLFGTCDVPAKSNFMNMKGHSGYFSCSKCCIKGEKSDRTGKVMVFPHDERLRLRNDQNYQECCIEGINCKDGCTGVFGPSILYYMFSGSFIDGMTIDSMHCLFMGCLKLLLRLWFDEKYSGEPFSLRDKIHVVNERLRALKLPHFVQRLVIDIDKNLCYFKASLCRNLFFYILPVVLHSILQTVYFENFIKLVSGAALLNKSSISHANLTRADVLLNQFSEEFQNLYGVRHMTFNIHSVRHLALCVENTGNLYHMSCFKFEDLNGKLCALVHGTRHAILQISNHLSLLSELPLLIDKVESKCIKSFCYRAIKRSKNFTITEKICDKVYVVGKITNVSNLTSAIQELVFASYGDSCILTYFQRLYKDSVLYVSSCYEYGSRVSSYCKYRCHNEVYLGNIVTFVKVNTVIGSQYFAFIERCNYVPINIDRFVKFSHTEHKDLVPVSELLIVSFCLSISGELYVVDPLNSYELE